MCDCNSRPMVILFATCILVVSIGSATAVRAQFAANSEMPATRSEAIAPLGMSGQTIARSELTVSESPVSESPVTVTPRDPASASVAANGQTPPDSAAEKLFESVPDSLVSPKRIGSTVQLVLTMTVLSLAPAILLMTTSFVRITVVLGLLRQAIGIQQLPSNQVVTSIAMFMTLLVMTPVWTDVYNDAISPYTDETVEMSIEEAWNAGVRPVRRFMSRQIKIANNQDDIWLFFQHMPEGTPPPEYFDDVPLQVLLPAFMLSELKIAFSIGFQIYLPFLILDIVVSSVTISMGMVMLPPTMISLPFKLLLFVLVDGWSLIVGMLLDSFAPYT